MRIDFPRRFLREQVEASGEFHRHVVNDRVVFEAQFNEHRLTYPWALAGRSIARKALDGGAGVLARAASGEIYHPFHSRFQPARARTPTPHEPRFIHWFPVSLVGKI